MTLTLFMNPFQESVWPQDLNYSDKNEYVCSKGSTSELANLKMTESRVR